MEDEGDAPSHPGLQGPSPLWRVPLVKVIVLRKSRSCSAVQDDEFVQEAVERLRIGLSYPGCEPRTRTSGHPLLHFVGPEGLEPSSCADLALSRL